MLTLRALLTDSNPVSYTVRGGTASPAGGHGCTHMPLPATNPTPTEASPVSPSAADTAAASRHIAAGRETPRAFGVDSRRHAVAQHGCGATCRDARTRAADTAARHQSSPYARTHADTRRVREVLGWRLPLSAHGQELTRDGSRCLLLVVGKL